MSLPTMQELAHQEEALKQKVSRLESAYADFVAAWNDIQTAHSDVTTELGTLSDNAEMAAVVDFLHKHNS